MLAADCRTEENDAVRFENAYNKAVVLVYDNAIAKCATEFKQLESLHEHEHISVDSLVKIIQKQSLKRFVISLLVAEDGETFEHMLIYYTIKMFNKSDVTRVSSFDLPNVFIDGISKEILKPESDVFIYMSDEGQTCIEPF